MGEKNTEYLIPITISEIKERFPELIIRPQLELEIAKRDIYLDIRYLEHDTGILIKTTEFEPDDLFRTGWRIREWSIELYKNCSI